MLHRRVSAGHCERKRNAEDDARGALYDISRGFGDRWPKTHSHDRRLCSEVPAYHHQYAREASERLDKHVVPPGAHDESDHKTFQTVHDE